MGKQISDVMYHAMYGCARMKCPSIFWILFSFFFFILMNAKCKCHMQMPWLVLPMWCATIVPKYAIDRLLTTDLNVHFLWMQTNNWCKSRFFISDANAFYQEADAKYPYDAHVLLSEMQFMMHMSHAMVQMQHLSMMVPAHVFTRDANVSLPRWRCKMSCGANAF